MITIEQMVQREVLCGMSSLVSTLARGFEECADKDLNSLCEQAAELAGSVLDYEEAAQQAGWMHVARDPNPSRSSWRATAVTAHWRTKPRQIARAEKAKTK